MNIVCIGGDPAGLYFALLMKKQDPSHTVTLVERNLESARAAAVQASGLSALAQANRAMGA